MVGSRPRIAVHYNVCVCVCVCECLRAEHTSKCSLSLLPLSPSLSLPPLPSSQSLTLSLDCPGAHWGTVSGLVLCTDRGGEVDMLVEVWVGMWWWRMQDVVCINDDGIRGCRREG